MIARGDRGRRRASGAGLVGERDGHGDLGGSSAGAKAMNHVLLRPETPVSAVPVLPATETPGIWAAVPGARFDHQHHHGGQRRLPWLGLIAVFHSSGLEAAG